MGLHVRMMPHNATDADMLAAANAADLVIIVESVNSGSIGRKIVSTPTPILISQSFLQDEFGLVVPPFVPVDPGYPGGITEAQLRAAAQLLQNAGLMLDIEVPPAAPAAAAPQAPQPAGPGANPAGPGVSPGGRGANPAGRGAIRWARWAGRAGRTRWAWRNRPTRRPAMRPSRRPSPASARPPTASPSTSYTLTEDGFRLFDAAVKWALTQK